MTKGELVGWIAEKAGISKKAADGALNAFVKSIHDSLKKTTGKIRVADLGTCVVTQRKARAGVNPQTRTKIKIQAKNVPGFRASKSLKEVVSKAK